MKTDQYTGTTITDLIALSNSVIELERKYVEAVSKMPPSLCQCLIVASSEDQYGQLCMKPCETGESYCQAHIDRRPWLPKENV